MQVASTHVSIAIAGAGFSGVGLAIRLKQAGFGDFVLLERGDEIGGVWRDNAYPGAACDVQSSLYSYSFALNPHWSHAYSRRAEIWDYLRRVAREHGIYRYVRFGHAVSRADFDERQERWRIETSRGSLTADVLVVAMGCLSEPQVPKLPGLASFAGKVFHSARWDHDYDLRGRKVAVIGTGASAVQFVPEIQPTVEKLSVFQRTPGWVLPRTDRPVSARQKRLLARYPILRWLARASIYLRSELLVLAFRHPRVAELYERTARRHLAQAVPDPVLREKLTPNFRIGCKRVLVSNDYLPALTRANVEVVTSAIREIRAQAIVSEDGREHPADAIIFGTGFRVLDFPFADHVRGRGGRSLNETWRGSPQAHLGTTVAGFPNLFLLLGPNTALGHTSVLLMLESQLALVLGALKHMRAQKLALLEPRSEAQARFVAALRKKMAGTVWTAGGCRSWYLDANGESSALWPRSTLAFRREARFRPAEYLLSRRVARGVQREGTLA